MQIENVEIHKNPATHWLGRHKIGLLISSGIAFLVLLSYFIHSINQPSRSVASFCNVAKEYKPSLQRGASNEQRLKAYSELERVAPKDIESDITTIRKAYEIIVNDPSKTFDAGFGAMSSEGRRTDYINKNCPDF